MASDTFDVIEQLSPDDYIRALKAIQPTEQQIDMLRIHLSAPDQVITMRHLASAIGFPNWNTANLHYGKFAGKICKELSVSPPQNLSVLVSLFKFPDMEWELQLRPAVVDALLKLGLAEHAYPLHEEYGLSEKLIEGAAFTVQVNAYERNPVARQKCIDHYGDSCFVCGFNFSNAYGNTASGYIHVHHLMPLASIGQEYVIDPVKDLRPLCANCHAVVHLRNPPYSIDEMRTMQGNDGGT